MKLHLVEYGLDGPPLLVAHGLLGSSDNWASFCRRLEGEMRVLALDMRNHGRSPHEAEMSYEAMAADLYEVLLDYDLDKVHLLGHSMGGKAAMTFATRWPEKTASLLLGDVADRSYPDSHHRYIFEALGAINPSGLASSGEAAEILRQHIPESGLRAFLLKTLERDPTGKGMRWRVNLQTLEREYRQIRGRPRIEGVYEGPALVVRGGRSDYVLDEDLEAMRSFLPALRCVTLKESGHWIHFDQPAAFRGVVRSFLDLPPEGA